MCLFKKIRYHSFLGIISYEPTLYTLLLLSSFIQIEKIDSQTFFFLLLLCNFILIFCNCNYMKLQQVSFCQMIIIWNKQNIFKFWHRFLLLSLESSLSIIFNKSLEYNKFKPIVNLGIYYFYLKVGIFFFKEIVNI